MSDYIKNLMVSIYGKTIENPEKRRSIQLVYEKNVLKHQSKFTFLGRADGIEGTDMRIIEHRPKEVKADDIPYVGWAVLQLSKLHMFRTFYDVLKPEWHRPKDNIRLQFLYTDTDSLWIEIRHPHTYDPYEVMSKKEGFCETFDCSEYDGNNPVVQAKGLINNINEMKLGKFKFDFKGVIINFRALGPKCYAANFEEYDKDGNAKLKEKKASKGYAKHIIDPKGDYEKRMTLDNCPEKGVQGTDLRRCTGDSTQPQRGRDAVER